MIRILSICRQARPTMIWVERLWPDAVAKLPQWRKSSPASHKRHFRVIAPFPSKFWAICLCWHRRILKLSGSVRSRLEFKGNQGRSRLESEFEPLWTLKGAQATRSGSNPSLCQSLWTLNGAQNVHSRLKSLLIVSRYGRWKVLTCPLKARTWIWASVGTEEQISIVIRFWRLKLPTHRSNPRFCKLWSSNSRPLKTRIQASLGVRSNRSPCQRL